MRGATASPATSSFRPALDRARERGVRPAVDAGDDRVEGAAPDLPRVDVPRHHSPSCTPPKSVLGSRAHPSPWRRWSTSLRCEADVRRDAEVRRDDGDLPSVRRDVLRGEGGLEVAALVDDEDRPGERVTGHGLVDREHRDRPVGLDAEAVDGGARARGEITTSAPATRASSASRRAGRRRRARRARARATRPSEAPRQSRALERGGGGRPAPAPLHERHAVAAPCCDLRRLQARRPASDDEHVLGHLDRGRFAASSRPTSGLWKRDRLAADHPVDTALVRADAVADPPASRTLLTRSGSAIRARVIATRSQSPASSACSRAGAR